MIRPCSKNQSVVHSDRPHTQNSKAEVDTCWLVVWLTTRDMEGSAGCTFHQHILLVASILSILNLSHTQPLCEGRGGGRQVGTMQANDNEKTKQPRVHNQSIIHPEPINHPTFFPLLPPPKTPCPQPKEILDHLHAPSGVPLLFLKSPPHPIPPMHLPMGKQPTTPRRPRGGPCKGLTLETLS